MGTVYRRLGLRPIWAVAQRRIQRLKERSDRKKVIKIIEFIHYFIPLFQGPFLSPSRPRVFPRKPTIGALRAIVRGGVSRRKRRPLKKESFIFPRKWSSFFKSTIFLPIKFMWFLRKSRQLDGGPWSKGSWKITWLSIIFGSLDAHKYKEINVMSTEPGPGPTRRRNSTHNFITFGHSWAIWPK